MRRAGRYQQEIDEDQRNEQKKKSTLTSQNGGISKKYSRAKVVV